MKNPGEGSVTRLRNGRFWVRAPENENGERPGLGTYPTEEEANEVLRAARARLGTKGAVVGLAFSTFGREVFDLREEDGYRGVDKDRDRFECHLADSLLGGMLLTKIEPCHVAELARGLKKKTAADKRGRRKIKFRTVKRILSLGSVIFDAAIERGLVEFNPFASVKIKRRADECTNEEVSTFLTLPEQVAFVTCPEIPYEVRVILRCLMGSGIRHGEAANNYLRDLHLEAPRPFLLVRYGSRKGGKDLPPKNNKTRKVYLFGDALVAFREWVEIRKTYIRKSGRHEVQRDLGLIFPTVTGCRRGEKFFGNGWSDPTHPRATDNGWVDRLDHYYHLAGIEWRPGLHVHALRHTCATSLLRGLWDPERKGLEIQDVCDHLGHSSIAVTMRYVHEDDARREATADRCAGYALVTGGGPTPSSVAAITSDIDGSHLRGLNSRPTVYEGSATLLSLPGVTVEGPPSGDPCVTALAEAALRLAREGKTDAARVILATLAQPQSSARP